MCFRASSNREVGDWPLAHSPACTAHSHARFEQLASLARSAALLFAPLLVGQRNDFVLDQCREGIWGDGKEIEREIARSRQSSLWFILNYSSTLNKTRVYNSHVSSSKLKYICLLINIKQNANVQQSCILINIEQHMSVQQSHIRKCHIVINHILVMPIFDWSRL